MNGQKLKQVNFAHHLTEELLPNFLELQRKSFDDFLQKDVPLDKKKMVGIHAAFVEIFGLAGCSDIYVTQLPENSQDQQKALKFLSDISGCGVHDVERMIRYNFPVVKNVKDEQAKQYKQQLQKYEVKVKLQPSGLNVSLGNSSVTLQYAGYYLEEPKYPLEDYKKARLYNIITSHSTTKELSYNRQSCKFTGKTYDARLIVNFRLIIEKEGKETKVVEEPVFITNIPIMTDTGSFIFNGAERVVITQIHKGHGVCFEEDEEIGISKEWKKLYIATIDSADVHTHQTMEFRFDSENVLYIVLAGKKILLTTFLRALGFTDGQVLQLLFNIDEVSIEELKDELTAEKNDTSAKRPVSIMLAEEIIDKQTGEVLYDIFTPLNGSEYINSGLEILDTILSRTNKKNLRIIRKEKNVAMFNTKLKDVKYKTAEEAAAYIASVVLPNTMIDVKTALVRIFSWVANFNLGVLGRAIMLKKLDKVYDELKDFDVRPPETQTKLTLIDIIATVKYLIHLNNNERLIDGQLPETDDVDHLGRRHVRPVGEQLEEELLRGLRDVARSARDYIQQSLSEQSSSKKLLLPRNIINNIPVATVIKKFFATGELSQFLDQTNPLSDLTSKRRFSALGPGGLSRKHAGFEVRDIHSSSYGRICPIETPEGQNIGLITSAALYSRVNDMGLIETPYKKVKDGKVTNEIEYLDAYEEEKFVIAAADSIDEKTGKLKEGKILARTHGEVKYVDSKEVQYVDVSPQQMFSVSAALIPFLEHDDANRALMGANMQRQAVPLVFPEAPLVATGLESKVAIDSCSCIVAKNAGKVVFVDSSEIVVKTDKGELDFYYLPKFERSNQDTCINYLPVVQRGQYVKKGEVLAGNLSTDKGQLALGKNVLVAFMSFEGYNFEDAILISERLVRDDVFTSITITEFETEAQETKLGPEEITRDLPSEQITEEKLSNLDDEGIVRVGAEVKTGDILVGKIVPTGEQATTVEERLLQAIFGKKLQTGKVVPLEVPPGVCGKVIWRQVMVRTESKKSKKSEERKLLEQLKNEFQKLKHLLEKEKQHVEKNFDDGKIVHHYYEKLWEEFEKIKEQQKNRIKKGDELPLTVIKSVKIYIASVRKIQVGDKLSGRHGNKGVVGKILPVEDMPFLPDGTPVDIVLSPLGVPSRMNVGQLFETMLGWAAKQLNIQYITPPFDGATEEEIKAEIKKAKEFLKSKGVPEKYLPDDDGKIILYDGRTGEPFMEKVFVGYMYMMKLVHMVEDKIHARSTGPYSLVTKQPLGGKAHFGGQRFGEMEVWALEGYGAAYTLQSFLTVGSDDVEGRRKIYESIIKGEPLTYIGIPESFKILIKELQALALNVEFLSRKYTLKRRLATKEGTKLKKK